VGVTGIYLWSAGLRWEPTTRGGAEIASMYSLFTDLIQVRTDVGLPCCPPPSHPPLSMQVCTLLCSSLRLRSALLAMIRLGRIIGWLSCSPCCCCAAACRVRSRRVELDAQLGLNTRQGGFVHRPPATFELHTRRTGQHRQHHVMLI